MARQTSEPKMTLATLREWVETINRRVDALEARSAEEIRAEARLEAKRIVRRERGQ